MEKHVVIVDFNHMLHTFYHGYNSRPLTVKVEVNGVMTDKNTVVQNGTLKNIFRWSKGGSMPTAVCFDRQVTPRKVFFQNAFEGKVIGSGNEYKGNREKMPEEMFEAAKDTQNILTAGGVSVFAENGYEADDLIMACIERAKVKYPGMHIDVVTNDADLLPLVDDDVSVYLRSKKGTFAEDKSFEKTHYIEVTPRNYSSIVEDLSAYKGFKLPYNTLLLHKLLRGDTSDLFGCKDISRLFSPKKWNAMIEAMQADGVDFEAVFRYGKPTYKILYRSTGEEFKGTLQEAMKSPDKADLYQKVGNPKELDMILDLLRKYSAVTDDQLGRIEKIYWGMNLNMVYPNVGTKFSRRAYVVGSGGHPDIDTYTDTDLHNAASILKIRLLR